MSRIAHTTVWLAAAVLIAGSAAAGYSGRGTRAGKQPAAPAARTPKPMPADIPRVQVSVEDLADTLARELKLSDEQKEKLKPKAAAAKEALAAWDAENKPKLAATEESASKARLAGNTAEADKADQQAKDLKAAREKLEAQQQEQVLAALSPEDRQKWEGYKLYLGLLAALIDAGMTAEQEEQVHTMANAAAPDLMKAETDEARAAVRKRLLDSVVFGVLNDLQRKRLTGQAPPAARKANKADRAGRTPKVGKPATPRQPRDPAKAGRRTR